MFEESINLILRDYNNINNSLSDTKLKNKIFSKVTEFYNNSNNKTEFYKTVYNVIGNLFPDLITLNLLLEKELFDIIYKFDSTPLELEFKSEILKNLYYDFIYNSWRGGWTFKEKIKNIAIESLDITEREWNNIETNENPLINKYFDLTIQNIEEESKTLNLYFLIMILWYRNDLFYKPFNTSKSIIITNLFNDKFSNNENIVTIINYLDNIFDLKEVLFSYKWINYIPLTDIIPDLEARGLFNQTQRLINNINDYNFLENINYNDFVSIVNGYQNIINESLKIEIKNKFLEVNIYKNNLQNYSYSLMKDVFDKEFLERFNYKYYKFEQYF